MSEYTLKDYFEHLGACDDGLEFVENSGASTLSGVLAAMDAENGGELDFVAWTLEAICEHISRSSDTGLEVRKLACLYAQTVIKNVQCAESSEFAEELQDLAKWTDPGLCLCDTADYIYQVKNNLMRITDYEQGRAAVALALAELSPEFERVWGLVTEWFDENSPPSAKDEVGPVLERIGACRESRNFFKDYKSVEEAFDALDLRDRAHRTWWFWVVGSLCRKIEEDGDSSMLLVLDELHKLNAEAGQDFDAAREIGELTGILRCEGEVSTESDSYFYGLRSYFDYDISPVLDKTRSALIDLWNDYVHQEGL